jgi:hypothetical protein
MMERETSEIVPTNSSHHHIDPGSWVNGKVELWWGKLEKTWLCEEVERWGLGPSFIGELKKGWTEDGCVGSIRI